MNRFTAILLTGCAAAAAPTAASDCSVAGCAWAGLLCLDIGSACDDRAACKDAYGLARMHCKKHNSTAAFGDMVVDALTTAIGGRRREAQGPVVSGIGSDSAASTDHHLPEEFVAAASAAAQGTAASRLRGVAGLIGGCAKHFTCCSEFDFFIPIGPTCVENEPASSLFSSEKDNCARNGQGKVPALARLETPEWRRYGVCNASTPVVTRAELAAREAKQRAWDAQYEKFCGAANGANCTTAETCYYDSTHKENGGSIARGGLPSGKAVCVCDFPRAREHLDGSGQCVVCKAGPDGKPAYVLNGGTSNPKGAKSFGFGSEFACALGPKED